MKHFPSPQKVAPDGAAEPPQTDDVGEALRLLKNLEVGRALGRRLKELEATVATLRAQLETERKDGADWRNGYLTLQRMYTELQAEAVAVRAGGVPPQARDRDEEVDANRLGQKRPLHKG